MSHTTDFDDMLPEVLAYVPTVPEPVAINAIRNAAIEFCQASHIWLFDHDATTVVVGVANYEFDPPPDTVVVRVHQAWFDTGPIAPVTEDSLQASFGTNWREATGTPTKFLQQVHNEILLVPIPDKRVVGGLKMTCALAPTRTATSIDTAIYERWAEKIAFGARARLHETPNQLYSDPAAAGYCRRMFMQGISQAKVERNRSLTRVSPRMPFPNFV